MRLCDSHCHFFSSRFLEILTKDLPGLPADDRAAAVAARLGWDAPGSPEALADRWVTELDSSRRRRLRAHRQHPRRRGLGGDCRRQTPVALRRLLHVQSDRRGCRRTARAARSPSRSCAPSRSFQRCTAIGWTMRRWRRCSTRPRAHGAAVFVHCGVLSVGVRKKLGLPSPFDLRLGDPLAVAALAQRFPSVPVIIPHFGAGLFREALMAADQCPNIHLDTSSSNSWMKYHPGLTLEGVFRQALTRDRTRSAALFGTDSSFFPRGWQARSTTRSCRARRDRRRATTTARRSSAAISRGCFRMSRKRV